MYTLVEEIMTNGVMEQTHWTEWNSRFFIIILALPPTRCVIQDKSLNLPGPISSSTLGCNSEFSLSFLKQRTGVLTGPQPNVQFLLGGKTAHQMLVDGAQGPFTLEELGLVQPAGQFPLLCVLHLHYPLSHSHNHPKCDHSNLLFQILYKSLFFWVVLWERWTG